MKCRRCSLPAHLETLLVILRFKEGRNICNAVFASHACTRHKTNLYRNYVWVCQVPIPEYNAAVVDTVKYQEICETLGHCAEIGTDHTTEQINKKCYLAYAVVGGKKSSTVVGKYNSKKKLIQSTANGGVGRRQLDLEKELKKKEGGKHRRDAFWVCVVTDAEYNAAVVDTVKYQEICTKWRFK